MEYLENGKNAQIVLDIIAKIHENASYLSEIDGATGDGDHGVNMDKGFMLAKERIDEEMSLSDGFRILGRTLVMDIGGSMGPIYGTMFSKMSRELKKHDEIKKEDVFEALNKASIGLMELAGARVGDKTLIDTLYPATGKYKRAMEEGKDFKDCLDELADGAEIGKENTKNLVAKIGRAARLGERSRGHLDAGATSCCIILKTMVTSMKENIKTV